MKYCYYFAYGSNMSLKQINVRCSEPKIIGRAFLQGYRFVYDGYSSKRKGAVANIIEDYKSIVWGVLFKISMNDLKQLDGYEGYPKSYDRKLLDVILDDIITVKAYIYLRINQNSGIPNEEYRNIIKNGAVTFNLPNDYVQKFIEQI